MSSLTEYILHAVKKHQSLLLTEVCDTSSIFCNVRVLLPESSHSIVIFPPLKNKMWICEIVAMLVIQLISTTTHSSEFWMADER